MTYDYICTDCGHAWEAEQRISEPPLKECPNCKHQSAKRQVSGGAGFILKGGGWYSDLYSSAKKPDKPSESPESKKSEAKSSEAGSKSSTPKDGSGSSSPGSGGTDGSGGTGGAGGSGGGAKTEAA